MQRTAKTVSNGRNNPVNEPDGWRRSLSPGGAALGTVMTSAEHSLGWCECRHDPYEDRVKGVAHIAEDGPLQPVSKN